MCQMGNGWYGNRKSFFILGLFCPLSGEEGQLAFCGGFREITTVGLFIVSHGTILVLLFELFLGFLPCCVAHVASIALVTIRLSFTKLVVGGFAWGCGRRPMVGICGIRRCAEVYGVSWPLVGSLTFRAQLVLSGQAKVNQGRGSGEDGWVRRTW